MDGKSKGFFKKLMEMREINIIIVLALVAIFMSFTSPHFATWGNFRAMMMFFSTDGIVAVGMAVTFIVGGIDLSVGAVMAMTMAIAGQLFLAGLNPWLASGIALLVCMLVGAFIGTMVTKVRLSHFVVTLAVMQMARGVVLILTRGTPLSLLGLSDNFRFIGLGSVGPLPFIFILFAVIAVVFDYLVRNSSIMRQVFFVGSNEKAARYSGIRVDRIKIGASMFTSTMAGLAGIIYMGRFGAAAPGMGIGLEMTVFAACVIGGVSMKGGKGTVFGAVLGIMLLTTLTTSMTLLRVSPHWQDLVRGTILLAAVSFDMISVMRKEKRTN